jgi:hypothetical protein
MTNKLRDAILISGAQSSKAAGQQVFPPMPALNAPLRAVYAELKAQARAGNAVAQCRLGYELRRCKHYPERVEIVRRNAAGQNQQEAIDKAAQLDPGFAADQAVCQDFTPDPGDEAWRYTLQAGVNGNDSAALSFIFGATAGLDPNRATTMMEGWEAYRDYAPSLLQQQIERGNAAAYYLAAQNSVRPQWGIPIIRHDPIQAGAFALALIPSATPALRAQLDKFVQGLNLTPADIAQAQKSSYPLAANLKTPTGTTDFSRGILNGDGKPNDASQCER